MKKNNVLQKILSVEETWIPILIGCLLVWILGCNARLVSFLSEHRQMCIGLAVVLYFSAFFFVVGWMGKRDTAVILRFILIGSFLFHALYVLFLPYNFSRHDAGSFVGFDSNEFNDGHFGYIEYLYKMKKLPDFDPRDRWCFYNPPFFHIVTAVFLGITRQMGVAAPLCYEGMQIVTLFASSLTIWLLYKIMEQLVKKETAVMLFTAMIAFHPFFMIYSAELTNDILSTCLMLLAFYYTLRWHEEHTMSSILVIALAVGLAMFTKLNAAMIAFGIAFIFLWDFWENRAQYRKYIAQFAAFLAVCAPIGLFWPIRNLLRFGMPILYIQTLPENCPYYIDGASILERAGVSSNGQLAYPFPTLDPAVEKNIWTQLFRTALFDEWSLADRGTMAETWGLLLFWVTILLALVLNAALIWSLVKKGTVRREIKIFIVITYLTMLVSYIKFCFDEPFISTMNFRYIALAMLFPILGGAFWLCRKDVSGTAEENGIMRVIDGLGYCLTGVSIALSFVVGVYFLV